MHAHSSPHADALQTLFSGPEAALISVSVAGWANSLLVQLARCPVGRPAAFSLYTLYREGSMTFEATVRFEVADTSLPLATVLSAFVGCDDYARTVLEPLGRQVRRHFHR